MQQSIIDNAGSILSSVTLGLRKAGIVNYVHFPEELKKQNML